MDFKRFSLGLRFAMTEDAALTPQAVWTLVFEQIPAEWVAGLELHGAWDDAAGSEPEPAYVCIFSGMPLKRAKKLYRALAANQFLCSYLTAYMPFVQNNWVEKCAAVETLGGIATDGTVAGGDACYADMRFSGSPPGKSDAHLPRPRILIAAEALGQAYPPADAARRAMRAAVRAFPSAVVTTARISDGGQGTLDTMVAACCGRYLRLKETGVRYGVLPDRTVVLETEQLTDEQTEAAMRRIIQDGYRAFLLAAGKRRMQLVFPPEIAVTVLSNPVPETPYADARIAYASGVETVLRYGDFSRLCAESQLVALITAARDDRCELLGATADTIRFYCEKNRVPCAMLARRDDGGYIVRPSGQPAQALADCKLDDAACALFKGLTRAGASDAAHGNGCGITI